MTWPELAAVCALAFVAGLLVGLFLLPIWWTP